MGSVRTALEFRVELDSNKEGMIRNFDGFYQKIIWTCAADDLFHLVTVDIIEFIAMTVSFADI